MTGKPSTHLFIPSPFKPRECVICGRREAAHQPALTRVQHSS